MSFRKIENDIKSGGIGKAAPVLLYGEEQFLVSHYEKRLVSLFAGAAEGGAEGDAINALDLSTFYGDEAGDDEIMAALDTFPMLLPARIVVVKSHTGLSAQGAPAEAGGAAKRKTPLTEYLSAIPDTARLIFTAGSVNKGRSLYKAIAKHGTVYEFARLDEADLASFARKRFNAMGVEISPGILDAFIFATGYLEKDSERDLFSVENDAYKLASFVLAEGRHAAGHSDLEECLADILRTDVFAMLDAISSGKKAESIQLLESGLVAGESAFRLLSLFTGHFEIMLGYKELSAEGRKPAEITQMLGERSEWRVKKLGGFAQRFKPEKLRHILHRLYDTERDIKSGDISERLALTVLLAEI
ncbi:MAG: DNA polymerase III subunit delta [Clostridiales bacterium]|nr:DNA polymerase III subunit delta [Clostridiales bacterium]